MGKPPARLHAQAIDHSDPVVPFSDEPALRQWLDASGSRTPLRVAIGARDDTSFIGDLVLRLTNVGLRPDEAEQAAAAALIAPTAAMHSAKDGRFLQSVVVPTGGDHVRVTVAGRLTRTGQAALVTDLIVEATPFDLNESAERAKLAVELARDTLTFPLPATTSPRRFTVVALGNPMKMGAKLGAEAWNDLFPALGRVLDVDLRLFTNQNAVGGAFPATTRLTAAFDPAFIGVAKKVGRVPTPRMIDCTGEPLAEVGARLAEQILTVHSEMDDAETPAGSRTLTAGEKVFHRKIGSSAAFDRFGAPCKQCGHPLGQYKRYHAAPKASKGMARLYSNFSPDMLYHCGQGYSCGVYAVFAPTNLRNPTS